MRVILEECEKKDRNGTLIGWERIEIAEDCIPAIKGILETGGVEALKKGKWTDDQISRLAGAKIPELETALKDVVQKEPIKAVV